MLPTVFMAMFLLLAFPTPASPYVASLDIRLERLTVSGDLLSVDVSGETVVAVGKSGQTVVWKPGKVVSMSMSASDLVSVSCDGVCLAVGRGGALVEIDPSTATYRSFKISTKDLAAVSTRKGAAAIVADTELLFYAGGSVFRTVDTGLKLSSVVFDGRTALAVAGARVFEVSSETGEVKQVAVYRANLKKAYRLGQNLYGLSDRGVLRDGELVVQGSFRDMTPSQNGRGFYLIHGQTVSFYDVYDGRMSIVASLENPVNTVVQYGGGVVAVGPRGFMALVRDRGESFMLVAPIDDYVAAVSDGSGGAVIASKTGSILRYREGVFQRFLIGDIPKALALAAGDVVVLGTRNLWVFDKTSGEVKPVEASIRASDFNDVSPSSTNWLTLVGTGGRILGIERDGTVYPVKATSSNLYAATVGYAVGDKVAVMLGPEPKTAKMDGKMVDVDSTTCGAIAVSDSGQIVYLRSDTVAKTSAGKMKLTTVSVNPRGAYALAGGSKGELLLFDGTNATLLPAALPEEVRSIAWIDSRTALVVTSKAVYRLAEERFPAPSLRITAPKTVEVFAGASKRLELTLTPVNGYAGEAQIPVTVSGMSQYVGVNPQTIRVKLTPLCPVKAVLTVSAHGEAGDGTASVNLWFEGVVTPIQVAVKKPLQTQGISGLPIQVSTDFVVAALIVIGVTIGVSSLLRRRNTAKTK